MQILLMRWIMVVMAFLFSFVPVQEALSVSSMPDLVPQTGHATRIDALSFAPNGRWLATGGLEGSIRIWDAQTLSELRTLTEAKDKINALAISPDSKRIAAACDDKQIRVWSVADGRLLSTFRTKGEGLLGVIKALSFSADGQLLIGGGDMKVVHIWDSSTGQELRNFRGHTGGIWALVTSSDSRWIATGALDKTIRIWDFATGRQEKTLSLKQDIISLAVSPDSKRIVYVTLDHEIIVCDAMSGEQERTLSEKEIKLQRVQFSPDGRYIAATSLRAPPPTKGIIVNPDFWTSLSVWDLQTGALVFRREYSRTRGSSLFAFNPTGDRIALSGSGSQLLLVSAATGERFAESIGTTAITDMAITKNGGQVLTRDTEFSHFGRVWDRSLGGVSQMVDLKIPWLCYRFSPDGRWVASGSKDGTVSVSNSYTGDVVFSRKLHQKFPAMVAMDYQGQLVASAGEDGVLKVMDIAAGKELFSWKDSKSFNGMTKGMNFSPDGRLLAVRRADANKVTVFSVREGKAIGTLALKNWAYDLSFSPDSKTIAIACDFYVSASREIVLWQIGNQKPTYTWGIAHGNQTGISFSADGKKLAAAGGDNAIHVWDLVEGREQFVLRGHAGTVYDLRFLPDDQELLTGSSDGSLRLWDMKSGAHLATLYAFQDSLNWIVVTPDGLFDGSQGAYQQLRWRFGSNTFDSAPLELFFNEFYYPGLLTELLDGKRPKSSRSLASIDRRQPQVALALAGREQKTETVDRQVEIKINIRGASLGTPQQRVGGVQDLRLFRNGTLVKRWQGTVIPKGQDKAVTLSAKVTLISGENRLVAYAFNDDNIKSADAALVIKGASSLSKRGTLYLLAVGLNEYANTRYNLTFAVPDADVFTTELKRAQTTLNKYENVEVIPLFNGDATKANILAALNGFAGLTTKPGVKTPAALSRIKPAQPEDALIIYYAGHGTASKDRFYLLPHDLGYAGDPANLTEKSLAQILSHGISDREIEATVEKIDAGRIVLIIDACNSGQALNAEEKRRGPMNTKGLAQLAYEKGMYVLTAAQAYQVAMEAATLGHGFLTFALAEEALKSDAADTSPKDGQVVLKEWLDYAVARVPDIHQEMIGTRKGAGRGVSVVAKPQVLEVVRQWDVQRPRVFYRREPETNPMVIVAPKNQ